MKPKEVIAFARENDCKFVDLKFIDLPGIWQHTTIPASRLDEDLFEEGIGFDGSSVRGWQPINASDMLMTPDPTTAKIDPFHAHRTLSLICKISDPVTGQPYGRDPRYIAQKAENYLKASGIADTAFFGPEAEFFVFDSVRYDVSPRGSFYEIDSDEAAWNTGKPGPNFGHKVRHKEGYFPVPPTDVLHDLRAEMMSQLMESGIEVEVGHHEVASAGQCEIGMRFSTLTRVADNLMWYKYVVKNVAKRNGKTATFMPKPVYGDNGSGMHCHQSLWKEGRPLFAGDGYAGLSDIGLWYIGGILKHASALAALTNPTTNSYRRLVPGYEAPVNLAYSSRNRSASIRIPLPPGSSPKGRRIEVRFPDATCNPYLAFAAMMLAGLDGIMNRIDPGDPLDKDIYALSPEELKGVPHVPGALNEALDALERNHEFLLRGDVFTRDIIQTWIDYKREREVDAVRIRPVPYEFFLYYDV
ncbi:type I glutamate--ammonia ligase [Chondromyces crocatus]|uniref:Glutamine synthetase n=1 Tax=Chondromyces crocatus TaxID=52 RepID=A0A0K1ERV5_CHOCO|nr:type I glutamate--ammonia ligase [Chondromyces crocatus]AKT43353.1 glutamine synthetase [Chondromyces crocatus]